MEIDVLEEYSGCDKPILHLCKKHNISWEAMPSNILRGCGCPKCGREKYALKRTKSHEDYLNELKINNINIIPIDKYSGANIPILHWCTKHKTSQKISPSNVLNGCGCKVCTNEKRSVSHSFTHDKYVKKLFDINPNIEVIGNYVNTNTKIVHHCLVHDTYWDALPSNILSGHGCAECGKDKAYQKQSLTHIEYVDRVKQLNTNIEVIGDYVNMKTPIQHLCKVHNKEWMSSPLSILQGCGCPVCKSQKISYKLTKPAYIYLEEIKDRNIILLEDYKGSSIPILHKCSLCGYKWRAKPANILSGNGCPKCTGNARRTQEDYLLDVNVANPNIDVIGKYINSKTPILHKCKLHNVIYSATPSSVLMGCGCQKCWKDKIHILKTKTHEEYIDQLYQINPNIVPLEPYIGASTKILHKCLKCNYEWDVMPTQLLRKHGCPKCDESRMEREIALWLDKKNIFYIRWYGFYDCRDKKPLPFDFYLPDYLACIEADGIQHFEAVDVFGGDDYLKYVKKHDQIKTQYCNNNNIKLLRIPYFKNIQDELDKFFTYLI